MTQRDLRDAAWLVALTVIGFTLIVVDLTVGFAVIAQLATAH